MGGLLLLALVVTGLGVLFGLVKPQRLAGFFAWLIFGPLLICLAYNEWLTAYRGLPPLLQLLTLVLLPFALLLILHIMLPKATWVRRLNEILFDLLVFFATFPFRFLWRAAQLVASRERHPVRLEPHQPVVGHRPRLRRPDHTRRNGDHAPDDH
jgi:hypothetical protein